MGRVWRTIRGYLWWTYDRGSFHYDVMVTLILIFIFLSPYALNFNDKPVQRLPHQAEVVIRPDAGAFLAVVDAKAVPGKDPVAIRQNLLSILEPIVGEVEILSYNPVRDGRGRLVSYEVRFQH